MAKNSFVFYFQVSEELDVGLFDYAGVEFRQAIQPFALTVTVGSVICFVCPFVSAEGVFYYPVLSSCCELLTGKAKL